MTINGTSFGNASFNWVEELKAYQSRFIGGGGDVQVREMEKQEDFLHVELPRMTEAMATAFKALVKGTLDFAATSTTLVDDYSTSYTGRIWSESVKIKKRMGLFYQVQFIFRVENTA